MANDLKPPALDPESVTPKVGSGYPSPFDQPCATRERRALGDAVGLSHFGVNLMTLPPGAWSSQRHWHENEDEFIYVLDGEVALITDAGEQTLGPGMAAGFPAGNPDGHQLVNRSDRPAMVLEVGTRADTDKCVYSDIDMRLEARDGAYRFLHKDGAPY